MTATFTKMAGVGFIVLSILRLTPHINITGKWLLYISIAAFFLILYDLVEFMLDKIMVRNLLKLNRVLFGLRPLFVGCVVMAIIVLPNIKIDISVKEVNALSDAFTLISLGIAITLIGFKTERKGSALLIEEKRKEDEFYKFLNSTEGKAIIKKQIEAISVENKPEK